MQIGKKIILVKRACRCLEAEGSVFDSLPVPVSALLRTTNELDEAEQDALGGDSVAIEKRN